MWKNQVALIIDIRSDSVGGALVEPRANVKTETNCPKVLEVSRHRLEFRAELNRERFFADLMTAFKLILADFGAAAKPRPDSVVVFLSAPFYASQTRTIKQTRPAPVKVTRRLISDLAAADSRQFQSQTPPLFREILHDAHELIEHKIMAVKLNRYETHRPFGQSASEIEFSHYLSLSSKKVLERFRELVAAGRPHRPIVFHTFPFALYAVCRDVFNSDNVLLLDLGGEVTEISLIAHNILWETVSFPLGSNFLIRFLAEDFKTVPEEALSALRIYQRGSHNKLASERMTGALARAGGEWLKQFKTALAALTETHLGPDEILAVGDQTITPVMIEWIKGASYENLLMTQKGLRASFLSAARLREHCADLGSGPFNDLHLLLEMTFYDKLLRLKDE
ncbi:MAG: cell division FtsA domain-containing protein [Candidatus Vogelbacteria bacterium]|nr:cell division FtsA domain-containing protein [Candidatus Vogelbacteria bacterium]